MSTELALVLLSPFMVLVLVAGVVIIVALMQASEQDVPAVFEKAVSVIGWLADRLPNVRTRDSGGASIDLAHDVALDPSAGGDDRDGG